MQHLRCKHSNYFKKHTSVILFFLKLITSTIHSYNILTYVKVKMQTQRLKLTPRSPRPDSNVTSKSRTNPSRRYTAAEASSTGTPVSPASHHAHSVLRPFPMILPRMPTNLLPARTISPVSNGCAATASPSSPSVAARPRRPSSGLQSVYVSRVSSQSSLFLNATSSRFMFLFLASIDCFSSHHG